VIANDCPVRKRALSVADRKRLWLRRAKDRFPDTNDCLHWRVIDDRVVARSGAVQRRPGARYLVVMVVMVTMIVVVASINAVMAAHAVIVVAFVVWTPAAGAVLATVAVVTSVMTAAPMSERGAASDKKHGF
jgi:hypothetical protein